MVPLSDELIDNNGIPRGSTFVKNNCELDDSNELDNNEQNHSYDLNKYYESNSSLFNQFGNFFRRLSLQASSEKINEEKTITDQEFQLVVQELREKNKITSFGILEILMQKKIKQHLESNKAHSKNKSKHKSKSKEQHHCPFQGKVNFLEKASTEVAEASKNPIYKRDSFSQKDNLRRVSNVEWKNMSQKWNSIADLLLDGEFDYEDQESNNGGFTSKVMHKHKVDAADWTSSHNEID